ncbi:Homoserine kinase [Austwickia sp. TVS 96-490-7B]|uniref:homoserine kinase n=1 Tax=Austwickia sp. TVS 96-490-7B TaxID=2830843 RepID=UPI001C59F2CD|nr:homoserine kinase [Austwickia sp. TVS 96-490-7B]MBW3084609.1 Homoserine kinase [Austwickia sp. TVS 96-490-7B]
MSVLAAGTAVRVAVPASSANLGPGFDAFGLALGVWDEYEVSLTGDDLVIEVTGEGADQVPRDARHLVYRCLVRGWQETGHTVPSGLLLRCLNRVPHSRGMGSSATAAVAGVAAAFAVAALSEGTLPAADGSIPVDRDRINELAAHLEGHPDNSSASVYGGMTLSWSEEAGLAGGVLPGVRTLSLPVHPRVVPVVCVPQIELSTAAARAALPDQVDLADAAATAGRAALLVEAISRRPEWLWSATRDWLHQEQRRVAYPASMAMVDALRADGYAAVISGAGPSVLVLTVRENVDAVIAHARRVAQPGPVRWSVLAPDVPTQGVRVTAVSGRSAELSSSSAGVLGAP